MGFPGSSYFTGVFLPNNKSDRVPTTWTVAFILDFLIGFFIHNSLIVLAYIGISWIACMRGIFIKMFLSLTKRSKSGYSIGRGINNISGNGGEVVMIFHDFSV